MTSQRTHSLWGQAWVAREDWLPSSLPVSPHLLADAGQPSPQESLLRGHFCSSSSCPEERGLGESKCSRWSEESMRSKHADTWRGDKTQISGLYLTLLSPATIDKIING